MRKAVFLDRDGTIIEDVGYLGECSKVRFLPRVSEAIKLLNERGFKVIIVTNQAGVARGYFTEETLKEINGYIQSFLSKQGALIDRIYYCPHHVEGIIDEYSKECHWRKPNPGMLEEAASEFEIDLGESFIIGDKMTDIEAGCRAGCRTILLADGNHPDNRKEVTAVPDHTVSGLYEAVGWLISRAD